MSCINNTSFLLSLSVYNRLLCCLRGKVHSSCWIWTERLPIVCRRPCPLAEESFDTKERNMWSTQSCWLTLWFLMKFSFQLTRPVIEMHTKQQDVSRRKWINRWKVFAKVQQYILRRDYTAKLKNLYIYERQRLDLLKRIAFFKGLKLPIIPLLNVASLHMPGNNSWN